MSINYLDIIWGKQPIPHIDPKIARYENRDKVLSKLENKFKLLNN